MRITEEQERILGSLHCERLSSNVDNFRLVDDFYNGRNPSIVNTLQNEAYEDDANHRVAYYVVKNNKNVGTTFAGVEIVHFCANEAYRDFWYQTGIHQKLGTVVFWQFIVPKILDLMEIVGCEYLFLFAADLSEDADLVNYYVDNLEFIDASEHSAATPMYDFACRFLCQETSTLQERRTSFFEHFNPDEEV